MFSKIFTHLLLSSVLCDVVVPYNILAILPIHGKSHFNTFQPILLELAKRGHHVTVYGTYPQEKPVVANYTDVDLSTCWNIKSDWGIEETVRMSELEYALKLPEVAITVNDIVACQPLIELRDTTNPGRYHLLITQFWITDWTLGYAYKFDIPVVGITSSLLKPWLSDRIGQIENPSYMRYGHRHQEDPWRSNVFSRIRNVYSYLVYVFRVEYYRRTVVNEIMHTLFGRPFPTVDEIARNTSLVLINSYWATSEIKPLVPAAVHFGGIIREAAPLPQDIEAFIGKFEDGVIYFSMGSVLKSTSFSREKRNAFVTAFSKLPSTGVIWKWEESELEMKSENIFISKWLPQRDILAHRKVRLFISHGGQSSINEAVHEGVPILGVPIFKDQIGNIYSLLRAGAADIVQYREITAEMIFDKINNMLQNSSSYRINAKKLSSIYNDRPMPPLDTAIYWIEYVIRHNGARHLRSPAVGMPWYQYYLVDIVLTVILFVAAFILIIYAFFKIFVNKCLKSARGEIKIKTN